MAIKTLVDTDSVQIITHKWLRDIRQFADNIDTLDKHGTINAALSNIGSSTQTTIVVGENVAVNANTDLTSYPNISWLMLGSGKLTPATGATLTLYSPDTIICPPYQHCLDASSGSVLFAKAGWAHPGWFGAKAGNSASTNKTALLKLSAAFGSVGGGIWWPGTTIQVDDTIAFTGPVTIHGVHWETSILESTAAASNKHGLTFTKSHVLRNLQVRTSTNLDTNYTMKAVSCDLDGVVSGGLSQVYENIKVRGFNIGLYGDGGNNYNIDRSTLHNVDVVASGPASTYIGSCLYQNRITQLEVTNVTLDQNNVGEHALYFFGSKNVRLDGLKIRNATQTESQAVKIIGNTVDHDQTYMNWSFRNLDIENCTNGVLAQIYGTEQLRALHIENVSMKDVDSTINAEGAVFVQAKDTTRIYDVLINNVYLENIGYRGVQLSAETSATIDRAEVANLTADTWSTASPGTYCLVGGNGDGTVKHVHVRNVVADGNTTDGRTILNHNQWPTGLQRVTYENLNETAVTDTGYPIALSEGDGTPSMAVGNDFTQGNGSAQNVTAYDHLARGQLYRVRYTTSNTTLKDGANLNLKGSVDYNPPAGTTMLFECPDGTALWEVSRSEN